MLLKHERAAANFFETAPGMEPLRPMVVVEHREMRFPNPGIVGVAKAHALDACATLVPCQSASTWTCGNLSAVGAGGAPAP
ncbi:MAG TPA: hypothetical protein DD456_11875 [Stenotrophomonas sp.]|nr:hypothetical protein [Stenotrophomonas sp.]